MRGERCLETWVQQAVALFCCAAIVQHPAAQIPFPFLDEGVSIRAVDSLNQSGGKWRDVDGCFKGTA